jgi:molybdopterin synthase catalytic subunit
VLSISCNPIDINNVTDAVRDLRAGAVVLFLGTVREFTGDVQTLSLDYEAFENMALVSLTGIMADASSRWPLVKKLLFTAQDRWN